MIAISRCAVEAYQSLILALSHSFGGKRGLHLEGGLAWSLSPDHKSANISLRMADIVYDMGRTMIH